MKNKLKTMQYANKNSDLKTNKTVKAMFTKAQLGTYERIGGVSLESNKQIIQ